MRALVLTALTVALLPSIASAEKTPATWLPYFETVARAQWPGSPCAGHEVVQTDADLPLSVAGRSFLDGSCRVSIAPGLSSYVFCATLTHEFGHLASGNATHSADPHDIMYPILTWDYAPCWTAVVATGFLAYRPESGRTRRRGRRV